MKNQNLYRSSGLFVLFLCFCVLSFFFFPKTGKSVPPSSSDLEKALVNRLTRQEKSSAFESKAFLGKPADPLPESIPEPINYRSESKKPPLIFQPLVFLIDSVSAEEFSAEEDLIIQEIQEKFAADIAASPSSDPASPEYRRHWSKAQRSADYLLLQRLGASGFNRFNSLAAQATEQ